MGRHLFSDAMMLVGLTLHIHLSKNYHFVLVYLSFALIAHSRCQDTTNAGVANITTHAVSDITDCQYK